MSFIKQLAGQTFIYGLGTILPRVLNYLLLTPFYTRIFQQAQYGVITELYAYSAFLLVLLTYGMETGFFRFNESEKNKEIVYSTSLITLFTTSVVFIIFSSFFSHELADIIRYNSHSEYIIWFAIIIGSDAFTSIPFAKLRAENKALKFSIIKIINVTINISLNIFFFIICKDYYDKVPFIAKIYNPEIGVGYAFISNLISSVVTIILLLPEIKSIKFRYDYALIKRMLKYSFPLLIVGMAGMINDVADKIFIKYLIDPSLNPMKIVGIYGANYKLAVLMTLFIQMFRYAAEPFFFAKSKEKNSKQMYAVVMKYFIIIGLFIFLGVMLFIDIVKYFIDVKFHEGLMIVPIVLAANLFLGIYYNLSVWYKLTNNTKYGAFISITGAIITIVLNFILIPKIGYVGSAWATFICYFSMMSLSYFVGKKFFYIQYDIKNILLYAGIALLIYILVQINRNQELINIYLFNSILLFGYILFALKKEHLYQKFLYQKFWIRST
ncbi:MAG: oligosaccharide flippase family protein [Chlorobi bacterium]|nr:oligosaccharide flippase family protein [Chlorobiota bacterium]